MESVWGVEHGEISKFSPGFDIHDFNRKHPRGQGGRFGNKPKANQPPGPLTRKWNSLDESEQQDAKVVGGVAGVAVAGLGVKYGTGIRALSRLKANPSQMADVASHFKSAKGPSAFGVQNDPQAAQEAYNFVGRQYWKNATETDTLKRKAMAGAADWEHFAGMNRQRKMGEGTGPWTHKLHPRYADHRVFREAVRQAPEGAPKLYRGIAVDDLEYESLTRPGHKIDGKMTSWSDDVNVARNHGSRMGEPINQAAAAGKNPFMAAAKSSGPRKYNTVVFEMEEGGQALNIQGMGRMLQREWVAEHPLEVVSYTDRGGVRYVKVRQSRPVSKRLTPLQPRPTVLKDTLSGRFIQSGQRKTADVLAGAGVSKRDMSDSELRHRKKAQGYISRTTSTLGLAALGMKGASVARAGGKVGRFLKVAPNAAQSARLDKAALNTGIVGSGIGGIGGYNFASYTAAEGKQKVKKNYGGAMDFGLGGVQQGEHEEISKLRMPSIKLGNASKMKVKSKVVPPSTKQALARQGDKPRLTPLQRNLTIGAGVGTAGAGGYGVYHHQKQKDGVAKGFRPPPSMAEWSATSAKNAASARRIRLAEGSAPKGGVTPAKKKQPPSRLWQGQAPEVQSYGRGTHHAPHLRTRASFADAGRGGTIRKAYDPERNRQKRLHGYEQATMFGAGALGAGAVHQGAGVVRARKDYKKLEIKEADTFVRGRQEKGGPARRVPGVPQSSAKLKVIRQGAKSGRNAALLGAGAAGLAMGSHRISSYRNNRGRSYSPMRTIGY